MAWQLRKVYLYITSLIGLILIIIGAVQLINLGLKTWVFTKADDQFFFCLERRETRPLKEGEEAKQLSTEEKDVRRKECEEERTARRQSDAARSIAFILVGTPVYFYHWNKVKEERE